MRGQESVSWKGQGNVSLGDEVGLGEVAVGSDVSSVFISSGGSFIMSSSIGCRASRLSGCSKNASSMAALSSSEGSILFSSSTISLNVAPSITLPSASP